MSTIETTKPGTERSMEHHRKRDEKEDNDEDTGKDPSEQLALYATKPSIKWIRGASIGSGSFGDVYLGMDAQGGRLMAVKQIAERRVSPVEEPKYDITDTYGTDIELWKCLHHENVVQYLESTVEDAIISILLEYVPVGSVTSIVQAYGPLEESLAANWVRQVLNGLGYLHEHMIIHENIKGSNVLVDNNGVVKISEPILSSKMFKLNERVRGRSVFYMAPETVRRLAHTSKVDIWSVGCVTIEMLTSLPPFHELTPTQTIFTLGKGVPPDISSLDITPLASEFLQKTFELDYRTRPSATELMAHSWLAKSQSTRATLDDT